MKEQSFEELDLLFSQAQVDLPPQLKARLMTIPHMTSQPTFWDLRWIIPAASLVPAIFWLLITKVLPLLGEVSGRIVSWAEDLVIPTFPAPSMVLVGFCLGITLATLSAGVWFYWNSESRVTLAYGKYLTGRI
ncbi:MAG: hypothetical protein JSW54_04800 [Fidelibacterota bacterium]|nr:MAG: hypothetical protein JSW54_04800 [Candidatus Neomarinimicrobiota bacterium]